MTDSPLVSVITPTFMRHDVLLNRCIPSVQAQTYPNVEHVVVCDGPDFELAEVLADLVLSGNLHHPLSLVTVPERNPERHWGSALRMTGIAESSGDLIAYIDDDDALRPEHCTLLAKALEDPAFEWAYSVMDSWSNSGQAISIGYASPAMGAIGTPMIMHRRRLLEHGEWGPGSAVEDWELVGRWMAAGQPFARVPEVTVDVWPSAYWDHS